MSSRFVTAVRASVELTTSGSRYHRMGSMDSEEKLVFDQIKAAGNMGESRARLLRVC